MKRTLLIFLIVFILMQFIQLDETNPNQNKSDEIQAPIEIMTMFNNSCYACHSNQTIWPIYSSIAPFSWIINSHVKNGRKALDFTSWEKYSEEDKKLKLKAIYRTVYAAMPLASYISLHEEAALSKKQREKIRAWTGVRR